MKNIKTKHWMVAMAIILVMVGIFAISAATAAKETPVNMVPVSFSGLAKTARPGVVNISTVKTVNGGGPVFRHFFGNPHGRNNPFREFFGPFSPKGPNREFKQRSLGSGFVMDRDGYIVTNNHVIEKADKIMVKLADGKEFEAAVVGRDPNTDLALIKIDTDEPLTPLEMGDSDATPIGGWVLAIGSPFGLEQTVTAGIVSAKGRVIGAGPYDDFIQTDASINPGNSGGPLLNMKGEVVGINTAIVASGQGIGFAIPVNLAKGILNQLKDRGEVTRGWLGVGIQDVTPELADYYGLAEQNGALVTRVYEGDPADKAGIRTGDVIVSVGGEPVSSGRSLSAIIADMPVGKQTEVGLIHDKKHKTVMVKLEKRENPEGYAGKKDNGNGTIGLKLVDLTPETARHFGYPENESGALVTAVNPDGSAGRAGVRTGDLIKEAGHTPVASVQDFKSRIDGVEKGETIPLLIRRGNRGFVAVKLTR